MNLSIQHKIFHTSEAYLAFEASSEIRHEYYLGNLIQMSGTSKRHNEIVFFLSLLFRKGLFNQPFDISAEQVKAFIKKENMFFYPDVMVAIPESFPFYNTQPILIAEVLSDSTREFDMTDKWIQYKKFDSLVYYILVEPEVHKVIVHKKEINKNWQSETYSALSDNFYLPALNLSITLKDIYSA